EQIDLIKKLEEKGYTYKTSDGIYFDTSKLKDYRKLAKLDISGLQEGKRIQVGDKKNKTDFALWKFSETPGVRQQEWKSPWGIGFPGWHIECSAMSMKFLGENFDIHTGGIDHIPIHHTNEIAQSEAATGKKFVNYWLHGNFLTFKGEKVSKSKGGLYTITQLEEKNFKPLSYRYLTLTTHYRKPLNFSLDELESSKNAYQRLKNIISELKNDKKINESYLKEFENEINNDLNVPNAVQILWKLVRDEKADGKIETIKKMDEVFGLDLLKEEKISVPKKVQELVEKREQARKNKDWKKADDLRNEIQKLGYSVDDSKEGVRINKI
ncbi:MAG: cysteine--tRNA ligase, partial [Nanoarchaeota archaeon]